jgi:hypothetical protein
MVYSPFIHVFQRGFAVNVQNLGIRAVLDESDHYFRVAVDRGVVQSRLPIGVARVNVYRASMVLRCITHIEMELRMHCCDARSGL